MYLLFMTQDALKKFEDSKGWTAGVDASVVMLSEARPPVRAPGPWQHRSSVSAQYRGFMADLSLDGTKFSKLEL